MAAIFIREILGSVKQKKIQSLSVESKVKPTLKIISGGQTGVDRAALEWALRNNRAHGGWCPKGRKAEDGVIPSRFHLKETRSENNSVRTRRNVRDSDGTVLFSRNAELSGGTKATAGFARELGKPLLHLVSAEGIDDAASQLKAFVGDQAIVVLNVAGPRESEESGLGQFVQAVLSLAFNS